MRARPDAPRYLLLGGTDPHSQDRGDAVRGRFAGEEEARQAFVALRLSTDYRDGWGELVGFDHGGQPTAMCWFGPLPARLRAMRDRHPSTASHQGDHGTGLEADPGGARPRRRLTMAGVLAGLAALAVAAGGAIGDGATPGAPPTAPAPQVVPLVVPPGPDVPGFGMES